MFNIGFSELIFLLILGLIVIGPKQLPEMARTIGRFINDLKRTTEDFTNDIKNHTTIDFKKVDSNYNPANPLNNGEHAKVDNPLNNGLHETNIQNDINSTEVITAEEKNNLEDTKKQS